MLISRSELENTSYHHEIPQDLVSLLCNNHVSVAAFQALICQSSAHNESSIDRCTWWTRKFPLRNQRPRLTMSASLHYWHNTTIGGIFKRPHALLSMFMMIWRILLKIKFHFEWPTNFAWSMAHWGIWLLRAITSQGWHAAWRPPLKWKDWRESFCWYHKVIPRRCLNKPTK